MYVGAIVGILSATVLFVNSFPDYEADRSRGRRTLVILLGKHTASTLLPILIVAAYALIVAGILLGFTKLYSLLSLASIPFAVKLVVLLKKDYNSLGKIVPAMSSAVTYSRITGFLLALSLIL
jgi:1,4-dihydroxy-2-naphthoate octaprenyltransferase